MSGQDVNRLELFSPFFRLLSIFIFRDWSTMKRTFLLATFLILLLAGCTANRPTSGQRWILDSMTIEGSTLELSDINPLTLEFSSDSSVGGSSGCNSYFGELTFKDGGAVTPENFGSTEMACERGMDIEAAFLTALSRVDQYDYSEFELILSADDGQTELTFQRIQSD
jgi:heat shock protein HslJ